MRRRKGRLVEGRESLKTKGRKKKMRTVDGERRIKLTMKEKEKGGKRFGVGEMLEG